MNYVKMNFVIEAGTISRLINKQILRKWTANNFWQPFFLFQSIFKQNCQTLSGSSFWNVRVFCCSAVLSCLSDSKWSVFGFWTIVGQQKQFLDFSSLHISWCCVWMCVLTRCPSPVWRWCVSWRLGSGPASGDPTAAASSGRSAPSSRGGPCRTDPPCVSNRGTDRERDRDKEGH